MTSKLKLDIISVVNVSKREREPLLQAWEQIQLQYVSAGNRNIYWGDCFKVGAVSALNDSVVGSSGPFLEEQFESIVEYGATKL